MEKDIVKENKKLHIAVYCRARTKEKCEEFAESCIAMIEKHDDWIFVGKYADIGTSGRSADRRLNFKKLIVDCENAVIDIILTPSVSQFFRNTLELLQYVEMLKSRNVDVRFGEGNVKLTVEEWMPAIVTFNSKT